MNPRSRLVWLLGVAASCAVWDPDPAWSPPITTASEQGRIPAIITTQEWSGGASAFCYGGDHVSGHVRFKVYPDLCIPLSYPNVSVQCTATSDDRESIELSIMYRFDREPPYRKRSDDCDRSGPLWCNVAATARGNYVVTLGDLALPVTVGFDWPGPCTNGESH